MFGILLNLWGYIMKLLTLNTHSWLEDKSDLKLQILVDAIYKEKFDIVALQEVNQLVKSEPVNNIYGYVQCDDNVIIKKDNFALALVQKLKEKGLNYFWSYIPSHIGYGIYDEGLAILSLRKIDKATQFYISKIRDYENFKTRRIVGVKIVDNEKAKWFFSVHMGWWNDKEDPFQKQWDVIEEHMKNYLSEEVYLMGDFNSPSDLSDEGYSYILNKGTFKDTYNIAKFKDSGETVKKEIDGWRNSGKKSMRIDYILKNNINPVEYSKTIFDGKNYPVVSDHFGVTILCDD